MCKKHFLSLLILWIMLWSPTPFFAQEDAGAEAEAITRSATREILRAQAILESLPDHGFGILKSVRNNTIFPGSVRFEKTLHDALPSDTIVRIKSLATGKYFTLQKNGSFKIDGDDPQNPATRFTIARRLSPNLHDWIGLAHNNAPNKMLQVDEQSGGMATFASNKFSEEEDIQCHWELVITTEEGSIDDCAIRNRKTNGFLTHYQGKRTETVKGEQKQTIVEGVLSDVWSVTPHPLIHGSKIIIQAGPDNSSAGKLLRVENGKYLKATGADANDPACQFTILYQSGWWGLQSSIVNNNNLQSPPAGRGDTYEARFENRNWGDWEHWSFEGNPHNARFKSRISGYLNLLSDGTVATKNNENQPAGVSGSSTFKFLPFGSSVTKSSGELPTIEYGKIITLQSASTASNGRVLWANPDSRFGGGHWEILAGVQNPDDPRDSNGGNFFMIKAKGNLNKTGPVNYGDEFELWSLATTNNPLNVPCKWWVHEESRWGGGSQDEILSTGLQDPRTQNGQQVFTFTSPNNATGPVRPGDALYIVSKFSKKPGARVWTYEDSRHGNGFHELLVGDTWGPSSIGIDRSEVQGKFIISYPNQSTMTQDARNIYTKLLKNGTATPISASSSSQTLPKHFRVLALRDASNAWAVAIDNTLQRWDGSQWAQVLQNVQYVAISSDNDVWMVDSSGVVNALNATTGSFEPKSGAADEPMTQVGIHNPNDAWAISEKKVLYHYNGITWEKAAPPTQKGIVHLSVSESNPLSELGHVWVVDGEGSVYRASMAKDKIAWARLLTPKPFSQVAVNPDGLGWGVGKDDSMAHYWDGKKWQATGNFVSCIAVAGLNKKVKVSAAETKTVDIVGLSTTNTEGKPLQDYDKARVAIEIVQLGLGGNLPAGQTVNVSIPVTKNPVVTGYAKTVLENFSASSLLSVSPMLSKGAAWPERALSIPNRMTVSFLARATDQGDIQIALGPEIADSFAWKVIIGGWRNTKSGIVQRLYQKGEPVDYIVYEIPKEQSPLAAVSAGNFMPYWVTYDNGFIMAGMGLPGENVFMAQRTSDPGANIKRVGFSNHKAKVEYADIQFLPPVVMQKPTRNYLQSKVSLPLEAGPKIVWTRFPFRIADRGAISMEILGSEKIALALGQTNDQQSPHYLITFSDKNEAGDIGISLKKWMPDEKKYRDRSFFKTETYQDVELSAEEWTKVWVSYQDGLFAVGYGDVAKNQLLVYQDLNEHEDIKSIGFANFGTAAGQIRNVSISSSVSMGIETQAANAYKTAAQGFTFSGDVTIILPFEYQFSQAEQQVKVEDKIGVKTYYPAGTPQQGALYNYMFSITEDGAPEMTLITEPENPLIKKIKQAAVTAGAAADLQRLKSEVERKEGERLRGLQSAVAQKSLAEAAAKEQLGETISQATATAGGAIAAAGPLGLIVGTAITVAGTVTHGVMAGIAADQKIKAAQEDYQGANIEALSKKKAQDLETSGAILDFQAKMATGSTEFAFRSAEAYVFIDKPVRPALGTMVIPEEAQENKKKAEELMSEASRTRPDDKQSFELLMSLMQDVVYSINHYAVVTATLKQKFVNNIGQLFQAYEALFAETPDARIINSFINLLFAAMNNGYLLDTKDTAKRDTWYVYANKLAQSLFKKAPAITLNPFYGEYLWYPIPFTQADQAIIDLVVEGQNDAFIALAQNPVRVRNTPIDIYELVLGGWDNTKNVIRTQSLGEAAAEFTKEEYPESGLNPYQAQHYQIILNRGHIIMRTAKSKIMQWVDPYPIKGIKWLGLSTWDTPITIKSIKISPLTPAWEKSLQELSAKRPVKTKAGISQIVTKAAPTAAAGKAATKQAKKVGAVKPTQVSVKKAVAQTAKSAKPAGKPTTVVKPATKVVVKTPAKAVTPPPAPKAPEPEEEGEEEGDDEGKDETATTAAESKDAGDDTEADNTDEDADKEEETPPAKTPPAKTTPTVIKPAIGKVPQQTKPKAAAAA